MQYVTKPKVEFVLDNTSNTIPFINDINAIYIGYRQCYTHDPCTPMKPLKDEEVGSFLSYISNYLNRKPILQESLSQLPIDETVDYLRKCMFIQSHLSHESPLEHAKLTVRITNLSRAASHQLVRHRLASFSQQSQRYVGEKNGLPISLPASIRNNSEAYLAVKECIDKIESTVTKLVDLNIPNEDIRCIYPNATCTSIIMSANFREWMHIFNERCCSRAQDEIRSLAYQILKYFKDHIPFIFDNCGPKCVSLGYCPESDDACCGRTITKQQLFTQIQFRQLHGKTWIAERNPNVPIPQPINSLDLDQMSSCEAYHAEHPTPDGVAVESSSSNNVYQGRNLKDLQPILNSMTPAQRSHTVLLLGEPSCIDPKLHGKPDVACVAIFDTNRMNWKIAQLVPASSQVSPTTLDFIREYNKPLMDAMHNDDLPLDYLTGKYDGSKIKTKDVLISATNQVGRVPSLSPSIGSVTIKN